MRKLERELKESKASLARKLGIKPQFLNQILKGERFIPIDKAVALMEMGYSFGAVEELLSPKNRVAFKKLVHLRHPAEVK